MASPSLTVEHISRASATDPFVRRPGYLERIIASTMLFVFAFSLPTGWFIRVSGISKGAVEGGSPLTTLAFLGFFGVAILALNGNWHILLAALGREPLLGAIVGLAFLSTLWSVNIIETFTSGVVLTITLAVGLYFSIRFRLEETLFLAAVALAVGLVINFAFIFFLPQFGLDTINVGGADGSPRWSGVFVTKNELARIASLSAIVFGFTARLRRSALIWPFWALLAVVQVVAAESATSLGATGGLIGLLVVFLGFRGRKTLYGATAVSMITVFSMLTLLAATNLATATGLLGKGSTFTGRLPLWINSFRYGISERPWHGYGYLAYWGEIESFEVQQRSNFNSPHAHNAFVDAWLYAGPLFALLLVALYMRGLVWGARNIRANPTVIGLVPIILISYGLIFSLTEAGVVRRDISFVLFVVAIVTAAKNKGARQPFKAQEPSKINELRDGELDQQVGLRGLR